MSTSPQSDKQMFYGRNDEQREDYQVSSTMIFSVIVPCSSSYAGSDTDILLIFIKTKFNNLQEDLKCIPQTFL